MSEERGLAALLPVHVAVVHVPVINVGRGARRRGGGSKNELNADAAMQARWRDAGYRGCA
jgi:hypothetical protein